MPALKLSDRVADMTVASLGELAFYVGGGQANSRPVCVYSGGWLCPGMIGGGAHEAVHACDTQRQEPVLGHCASAPGKPEHG